MKNLKEKHIRYLDEILEEDKKIKNKSYFIRLKSNFLCRDTIKNSPIQQDHVF